VNLRNRNPLTRMTCFLAIDLGTTLYKFTIFDRDGTLRGCCRIAPPLERPQPGYLELPAQEFLAVIRKGIAQVLAEVGSWHGEVEAICFATQANSFVLLDANDQPLTPFILWPDSRAIANEHEIQQMCRLPRFSETTGLPLISHQFMVAKLKWLAENHPTEWKAAKRLCLLSDYLTLALTGNHVTEAGAAGLSGLLEIRQLEWWEPAVEHIGLAPAMLPKIVRAGTNLGSLQPSAAAEFGLPSTCRFIVGCLDQYAGAIGVGAVEPGMVAETTGTVLATVLCAGRLSSSVVPGVFQGPSFRDDRCWQMAFGDVSANYLQWYQDQFPDRPGFEELVGLAETVPVGADGLTLRTSAGLGDLEEVFSYRKPSHTRGHFVRCILEAVADALAGQVANLCNGLQAVRPSEVRSAGGGAKSRLWLQIKADRLGIPVTATECPEPTSLGAAILARASLTGQDVQKIANQWVRLQPTCLPNRG
jgi:xylulokinase